MSIRASREPSGAALTLHHLLSRNSLIVAAALLVLALLAWAWLWLSPAGPAIGGMDGMDMDGMDMMAMPVQPWSAPYLLMGFAMWAIMMVAMMLPSAAPMILLHARIDRAETEKARLLHSSLFLAAYLLVWAGFAAVAVLLQAALLHAELLSDSALALHDRTIAAGLLLLAATYELTPAKGRCLENCRSPLIFVHRFWRPGAVGAFRLGLRHGLYCVGCCWALMLLLFVGGVMNLAWVALLAILATVEKALPPLWHVDRWMAAILLAGALLIALR